jgi:demethylmenaquinone methyltransferase/2-methoxy-6-polyprenyl-1,4-benzoquinol methylase
LSSRQFLKQKIDIILAFQNISALSMTAAKCQSGSLARKRATLAGLDHFGLIAPFYERFIRTGEDGKLGELLNLPVNGWLLDVGGGTGRIANRLVGLAGAVIVADVSLGMLNQAQQKTSLIPVCSASEALAFPDDCFERILIVDAFHHVSSQHETAHELWRVLKPGGRLVIQEPDIRTLAVKFIALAEKLLFMRSHFLSPAQITGLFMGLHAVTDHTADKGTAWIIVDKPAESSGESGLSCQSPNPVV